MTCVSRFVEWGDNCYHLDTTNHRQGLINALVEAGVLEKHYTVSMWGSVVYTVAQPHKHEWELGGITYRDYERPKSVSLYCSCGKSIEVPDAD